MKSIKVRAWDKKEKKMFYFNKNYSSSDNEGIPCLTNKEADYFISYNDLFDVEQKDYIPLQFTGLKDKNRKEIYEGDVLEYRDTIESSNDPMPDRRIVVRDKDTGQLTHAYIDGNTSVSGLSWCKANAKKYFKVIGNIYENKELLK